MKRLLIKIIALHADAMYRLFSGQRSIKQLAAIMHQNGFSGKL